MSWLLPQVESRPNLSRQVKDAGGQDLSLCYQCGKCTAGCPVAYEMDYPPSQIMRGVQLGMRDIVLSSKAIWLCTACETCTTRCPQEVDPAGVMDTLRRIAYAEGVRSSERDVPLFHRIFLGTVRQFGRLFEAGLAGFYNVFSGHYTKDVAMVPRMLLKGKLALLPPRDQSIKGVKEMFDRVAELEGEQA